MSDITAMLVYKCRNCKAQFKKRTFVQADIKDKHLNIILGRPDVIIEIHKCTEQGEVVTLDPGTVTGVGDLIAGYLVHPH